MDKGWVNHKDRCGKVYQDGLRSFLEYAFKNGFVTEENTMRCPCGVCNNIKYQTKKNMFADLVMNGMMRSYTTSTWFHHGEIESSNPADASSIRPQTATNERWRLTFLNDRRDGDKIPVELFLGKPLSEKLSHYIGFLAKDGHVLPLSVPNWKYMRPKKIERAIREIKYVFDLPENVDDTLRGRLNTAWRKHKSAMKKEGFDPDRTTEENLANRPEDVLENQWGPLVEMWEDEKNQIIAAKNVENILQQTLKHTGGSKPHLSYAKELKDSLGRFPERLELFEVTHQKKRKNKDDEPVMEPLAAELYGRMVEFRKQASQPGSGVVLSGPNDAVSAVMGADKKGRVRCLGSTVKPKEFWGDEASSSKTAKLKTENDNLRRDLELKDKRILELETQVGTLQSILNGYLAFYGRRDELPPNSNNGGLVDLLMDMQGNFTRAMVEASNDYIVEASNDSRVDHNQQQS